MRQNLLLWMVLVLSFSGLQAQDKTISGKVTSGEDGLTLPGVNVVIDGTSQGTVTDVDGNYIIQASGNAQLVFSSVGYLPQTISVNGRSVVNVTMQVDVMQLQEIVVTGYGEQNKRDLTGAISSVKSKQLAEFSAPSLDAALQGQAAGIQVTSAGGVPGAPVRVLIRGTNSLTSGTEPLWIIDGMPISNPITGFANGQGGAMAQSPLANINPNDIESIEILKDAAATAIYGSRGSNGVILVTTKTGKGNQGSFSIDLNQGVTDLTRSPEDLGFVNGDQWLELADQARANSGLGEFDPNILLNNGRDPNAVISRNQLTNTNWFDQILQKGSFTDLNLSTSKGTENTAYYISGQYRKDEGVLKGNDFTRAAMRANLDFNPVKNLSFGTRLTISYTKNDRVKSSGSGTPGGNNQIAFGGFGQANGGALPIYPIWHPTAVDAEGNPLYFDPLSGNNLLASIDRNNLINDNQQYRGLGSVFAEYALPWVPGLSIRAEGAIDFIQSNTILWANTVVRVGSNYAFQDTKTFRNYNYNVYATYNKTFAEHDLNLVFGTESQQSDNAGMYIEGDQLLGPLKQAGTPVNLIRVGGNTLGGERYIKSFFGRANYKFKDKYLLGASLRRDGSSVFTEENRWSFFTAFSGGWILSEEQFMENISFVNFLKVRGSFGQTGNQDIDPFATEFGYTGWSRYGSRDAGVGAGDNLSRIGNQAITWETTNAYDFGVDFEILQGKVAGSAGYYMQNVTDLILQVPIAQSSGIFSGGPTIAANIGDMKNYGLEFSLDVNALNVNGFRWDISANLTTNANEVTSLNSALDESGAGINEGNTITRAGAKVGAFFMNRYAGIDPETGVEMIYALDRDHLDATNEYRVLLEGGAPKMIPATRSNTDNNRFLEEDKTGLPTYFGGFTNSFSYKGFDLNVMFSFQGGNWIYDESERGWTQIGTGGNILRADLIDNSWTPENRDAIYPELRWNYRYDIDNDGNTANAGSQRYDIRRSLDRYAYKGDFLRLRSLQIAYTVPAEITQRFSVQNLRIYLRGNNLLTLTGFDGYDPEAVSFGGAQSRNLGQGFINPEIPQLRSWSAGLSVTF